MPYPSITHALPRHYSITPALPRHYPGILFPKGIYVLFHNSQQIYFAQMTVGLLMYGMIDV